MPNDPISSGGKEIKFLEDEFFERSEIPLTEFEKV